MRNGNLALLAPLLAGALLWAFGYEGEAVRHVPRASREPRVYQWIRYDRGRRVLRLRSAGGHIREYRRVPAATAFDLLASENRPAYFSRFVRNQYPFRLVQGEEP